MMVETSTPAEVYVPDGSALTATATLAELQRRLTYASDTCLDRYDIVSGDPFVVVTATLVVPAPKGYSPEGMEPLKSLIEGHIRGAIAGDPYPKVVPCPSKHPPPAPPPPAPLPPPPLKLNSVVEDLRCCHRPPQFGVSQGGCKRAVLAASTER